MTITMTSKTTECDLKPEAVHIQGNKESWQRTEEKRRAAKVNKGKMTACLQADIQKGGSIKITRGERFQR